MKQKIFLISGPLGVGKSTVSKLLSKKINKCVLLEADDLFLALEEIPSIKWENRLKITWNNILHVAKEYIKNDLNVVIDFVVEDELEWFINQTEELQVEIKYVVLHASEDIIKKRLKMRGDIKYLDRALKLRKKLMEDEKNKKYLLNISKMEGKEIVRELINNKKYEVS